MAKDKIAVCILGLLLSTNCMPVDDNNEPVLMDEYDNEVSNNDYIDLSHLGPEIYGLPRAETGEKVGNWTEQSLENPEELGEYAEGDILFPGDRGAAKNGLREQEMRWPSGVVPYVIEGHYSQQQRDTIMKAIADYHRLTCLRFVPRGAQTDYLAIQSRNTGCWSSVGRIGGRQELNLQAPGCVTKKGTVLHELLHAVGFLHEQSRPERDKYVTVKYTNVKPGSENNFKKAEASRTGDFGVSYDYNSVMHYSEYAFSKNGQRTIEPRLSNVKLGQRDGLSRGDVRKVNNMYECNKQEPEEGWLAGVWAGFFGN